MLLGIIVPEEYKEKCNEYVYDVLEENNIGTKDIEDIYSEETIENFESDYFCQIEEAQIGAWFNKERKLIRPAYGTDHFDMLDLIQEDFENGNVDRYKDIMMIIEIDYRKIR